MPENRDHEILDEESHAALIQDQLERQIGQRGSGSYASGRLRISYAGHWMDVDPNIGHAGILYVCGVCKETHAFPITRESLIDEFNDVNFDRPGAVLGICTKDPQEAVRAFQVMLDPMSRFK